jgi:UDP-N-acetylglucosamine 2-epimerase (non-hydrolysing)
MVNGWPWRIDCIVGARPNLVKMAPILRALRAAGFAARLIHTGQHYDVEMNAVFFKELEIPEPDVNLEVGSGSGTEQTAQIMLKLEPVLRAKRADLLLVVGDVNSTLAAALVAAKLQIPLAHVEAGLRSNDRSMPEEINRLVTDRLSDMLLTTEENAMANLVREGIDRARITFVGNVVLHR